MLRDNNKNGENPSLCRLSELVKDNDWQAICNYWKNLNHLNKIFDKNKRREILAKLGAPFDNQVATIGLDASLNNLETKKLLLPVEKKFLRQTISERYYHISGEIGLISCYFIGGVPEERQLLNDLENRYKRLESLYNDNKINSNVYIETKTKIIEDLKLLEANRYTHKTELVSINDELLDILVSLNK